MPLFTFNFSRVRPYLFWPWDYFFNIDILIKLKKKVIKVYKEEKYLTFSSTVFLILAPASLTVLPALLTAENRKLLMFFAPWIAFVETETKIKTICIK